MIRNAREDDIPSIMEIENTVFFDPWPEAFFREEILESPYSDCFIYEEEGEIIAYGFLIKMFEQGDISNIAVKKEYQGKGFGQKMLEYLIKSAAADGVEYLHLEVRPSNLPAHRLYQKYGFIQSRIRKNYYEDGEDAIEMVKPVGGVL